MSIYQEMYAALFNAVTDALNELDKLNIDSAKERLKRAQIQTEEMFMSQAEEE